MHTTLQENEKVPSGKLLKVLRINADKFFELGELKTWERSLIDGKGSANYILMDMRNVYWERKIYDYEINNSSVWLIYHINDYNQWKWFIVIY